MDLPALTVRASGSLEETNADIFLAELGVALDEIDLHPSNDAEFNEAAQNARGLAEVEKTLRGAVLNAVPEEVETLRRRLEKAADECKEIRLRLTKTVNAEKAKRKNRVVEEELDRLDKYTGAREHFRQGAYESTKGKRTEETTRKAVAAFITAAILQIENNQSVLNSFPAHLSENDAPELVISFQPEALAVEMRRRQDNEANRQARLEETKARHIAEEKLEAAKAPDPQSAAEEWEKFEAATVAAFAPLKEARAALVHPQNIERAATFALKVSHAWKHR